MAVGPKNPDGTLALGLLGLTPTRVIYQGYIWEWTGVGWDNIGYAYISLDELEVNNVCANVIHLGNSTSNVTITGNGVLIENPTSNTLLTANILSIGNSSSNTHLESNVIIVTNTTTNVVITPNTIFIGNSTGYTVLTSNQIITANSTTNTVIDPARVYVGNSTSNTEIKYNKITVGANTIINTSSFATTNTILLGTQFTNTYINTTAIVWSNTSTAMDGPSSINAIFYSGTANNALYLQGIIGTDYSLKTYVDTKAGDAYSNLILDLASSGTVDNATKLGGYPAADFIRVAGTFDNIHGDYTFKNYSNLTFANTEGIMDYVSILDGTYFISIAEYNALPTNEQGLFVASYANAQIIADFAGVFFTGTAFRSLDSDELGGQPPEYYLAAGDLPDQMLLYPAGDSAKLGGRDAADYVPYDNLSYSVNLIIPSGSYTWSEPQTFSAGITFNGNITINGTTTLNELATINKSITLTTDSGITLSSTSFIKDYTGSKGTLGQLLVSDSHTAYWADPAAVVDQTADYDWTGKHTYTQTITGTIDNALQLDGIVASDYALKTYADSKSGQAYTNAMSNTLTRSGTYTGNNTFAGGQTHFTGTYLELDSSMQFEIGAHSAPEAAFPYANRILANPTNFYIQDYTTTNYVNHNRSLSSNTTSLQLYDYSYNRSAGRGFGYINTFSTTVNTSTILITNTIFTSVDDGLPGDGSIDTNWFNRLSVNTTLISLSNTMDGVGFTANISPNQIIVGNNTVYVNTINGSINFRFNQKPEYFQLGSVRISRTEYDLIPITEQSLWTYNSSTSYIDSYINATSYTGQSNSALYFGGAKFPAYVNTSSDFTLSGNITFNANIIVNTIVAGGTRGLGGQILTSNNAGHVFWSTVGIYYQNNDDNTILISVTEYNALSPEEKLNWTLIDSGVGTVSRVETNNGLTGGPIVGFGTLEVLPGTGIVANATGVHVNNQYLSSLYAPLAGASFTGDVYIGGNFSVGGQQVIIGASDLVVNDSVISIHTPSDLSALTVNDGKAVGIAMHYYNGGDKQALLAINQANSVLTYYNTSTDAVTHNPVGQTLGIIQAGSIFIGTSSGAHTIIDSTSFSGKAADSDKLDGVSATSYVKTSGDYTLGGNFTLNGTFTHSKKVKLTANLEVNGAIILPLEDSSSIGPGTKGQVITSNGTSNAHWAFSGTVTEVSAGDGLEGNPITTTGSLSVKAANGIHRDVLGVSVYTNQLVSGLIVDTSGVHINAAHIGTLTANNTYYLVGVDGNEFLSNTKSDTLSGNIIFNGTNTNFYTNLVFGGTLYSGNLIPDIDAKYFIGNNTNRIDSIYITTAQGGGREDSGLYVGNTYITDDPLGSGFLWTNGVIANTANLQYVTVDQEFGANNINANTIILENPLSANDGGTGLDFYAVGDLLYAATEFTLDTISIPVGDEAKANGQILQIINNMPAYGGIDCGEFVWAVP